ncbi:MAG TPA: hypothetical protein VFC21_02640 [Bryobacteraceae bacterium]|nr:hypothetical protein [Bryobacteraceae bacterium]
MSFRNGDKARSGRLRKQRDHNRAKTRALRASLTAAPPVAANDEPDTIAKKTARTIGSALGSIATATHLK